MEIGKIKQTYRSSAGTDGENDSFCIIRMPDNERICFRRDGIRAGSELLSRFSDCDGCYVVFDVAPNLQGKTKLRAVNVCCLEEADPETLAIGLSQEVLSSAAVRELLQERCPMAILGNDPQAYFPLLKKAPIREAFAERARSGKFGSNLSAAIAYYLRKWGKRAVWSPQNWSLIDWKRESPAEMRKMCIQAAKIGINITPMLSEYPFLWREDKDFLKSLSLNAVQTFLLSMKDNLSREDFKYLYGNLKDKWLRMVLCGIAPLSCILEVPEAIHDLQDNRILSLIGEIQWDRTDEAYIAENGPFLSLAQTRNNEGIYRTIASAVLEAWIMEDSPWWPYLSREVQNRVLQKYRESGVISGSNSALRADLEGFLARYYPRDKRKAFSFQQKEAIQAVNGVTLLFAVPGSGKTTVIVARAGYMVHGLHISPEKHLIMTFGKSAAKEMEDRYKAIFREDGDAIPNFRTIHSFCFNVVARLREKGEIFPMLLKEVGDEKEEGQKQRRAREIVAAICGLKAKDDRLDDLLQRLNLRRMKRISPQEARETEWFRGITLEEAWQAWQRKDITQKGILRQIMNTEAFDEEANVVIDTLATLIGFIKNRMLPPAEIRKINYIVGKQERPIEPIYTAYQNYLNRENLMDFDDMLQRAYQGLKKYPDILKRYQEQFPYVSLDETQDTSMLQHEIVALLVGKSGNLFMVGDDDQSIYSFRGAVPSEMLEFKRRYPAGEKLQMGINYRSDINIVRSAERFVKANVKRENKQMRPQSQDPGRIQLVLVPNLSAQYAYIMEAAKQYLGSGKDDMAILFRWNASAFPVMAYFYHYGIPFVCRKQQEAIDAVLTRQETKRIMNLLRYSQNLSSMEAFRAAWYVCYRGALVKDDLNIIEQIWQRNRTQPVAEAALQFLATKHAEAQKFRNAHQDVLKIAASSPRAAIAFMLRHSEYGIVSESGENSINTWMRIYAVLSAAELCADTRDFLQMVDTMQNREIRWHPFSKRICLSTMHSAKGAEFDRVLLIDTLDDITPGPETGNDVWYDAEEERRLFYVAVTRARHELNILQTDIYHDRHLVPSRFIGDYHAENPCVEVISYSDGKKRGMMRLAVPHYVIRQGPFAGIYSSMDDIDAIHRQAANVPVIQCPSYVDAIICMHKGVSTLNREGLRIPADLPDTLTGDLRELAGIGPAETVSAERVREIREKAERFLQPAGTQDLSCAMANAFLEVPENLYKVWVPFLEMLPSARLPADGRIRILEIGAGSGAVTLGVLQFYWALAARNPDRKFQIEYFLIEENETNVEVMSRLLKIPGSDNFAVDMYTPLCGDEQEAIEQFAGAEIDLIIERNRLNPARDRDRQAALVGDICAALRNYGFFLMLEQAGPEEIAYLRTLVSHANKTDSLLYECLTCDRADVDLSGMQIVQDMAYAGLREKETESFSYVLLERKDVEVRSV